MINDFFCCIQLDLQLSHITFKYKRKFKHCLGVAGLWAERYYVTPVVTSVSAVSSEGQTIQLSFTTRNGYGDFKPVSPQDQNVIYINTLIITNMWGFFIVDEVSSFLKQAPWKHMESSGTLSGGPMVLTLMSKYILNGGLVFSKK